jgi:hypothetical protein
MGTWIAPSWSVDAYTGWASNTYLYQDILGMLSDASSGGLSLAEVLNPQQFDANATIGGIDTVTQLHFDKEMVPHGAILGRWVEDDFDCSTKDRTGFCRRRFNAREWSNQTMSWSNPKNLTQLL